jgi:hypothetical protein
LHLHPNARVDATKIETWERALRETQQNKNVIDVTVESTRPRGDVAAAPNGVVFPSDYVDWKFVSATNRFDNHTLRLILGNAIATRAIEDKRIRPWPDGAAFVKIAWDASPASDPSHAKLIQIETMIKDARAHASTEGWGFGRWKTDAFLPYGKDASFTDECAGCHAPVHEDDFVYTMALGHGDGSNPWNSEAALPARLPFDSAQSPVVGASFDLAADTIAITFRDATRTRVTWSTQDDRHWFGGRIPAAPRALEILTSTIGEDGKPTYAKTLDLGEAR